MHPWFGDIIVPNGNNSICLQARASCSLGFTYLNDIQTTEKSLDLVTPLDLRSPTDTDSTSPSLPTGDPVIEFTGFADVVDAIDNYGTQALNLGFSLSWKLLSRSYYFGRIVGMTWRSQRTGMSAIYLS